MQMINININIKINSGHPSPSANAKRSWGFGRGLRWRVQMHVAQCGVNATVTSLDHPRSRHADMHACLCYSGAVFQAPQSNGSSSSSPLSITPPWPDSRSMDRSRHTARPSEEGRLLREGIAASTCCAHRIVSHASVNATERASFSTLERRGTLCCGSPLPFAPRPRPSLRSHWRALRR